MNEDYNDRDTRYDTNRNMCLSAARKPFRFLHSTLEACLVSDYYVGDYAITSLSTVLLAYIM